MKAAKRYAAHLGTTLSALATWLPSDRIAVGDIGQLERGMFTKLASLTDLGITFEVEIGRDLPTLSASTTSELEVRGDLEAPKPGADQLLEVKLAREGSTVFEAEHVKIHQIKALMLVEAQLEERLEAGKWRRSWVLVDRVWTAQAASIVVSTDANTVLRARGPRLQGIGALAQLASGGLENVTGSSVRCEGMRSCTPLFTARKFGVFGRQMATTRSAGRGAFAALGDGDHHDDPPPYSLEATRSGRTRSAGPNTSNTPKSSRPTSVELTAADLLASWE